MSIYHIAETMAWQNAQPSGVYEHDSLRKEGFIHCSTKTQLEKTANRYFKDKDEILVLKIDTDKLTAPLKFEQSTGGELFPHIYGVINAASVVTTFTIHRADNGGFIFHPD